MIQVTRLNGSKFVLNADLIETMEETPDTVITIRGGNKYIVAEPIELLIRLITEFKQRCHPLFTSKEGEGMNDSQEHIDW